MRTASAIILSLSLFACEDEPEYCSDFDRRGTYLVSFSERSGTCGQLAEEIVIFPSQPANGCESWVDLSRNNCRVTATTACLDRSTGVFVEIVGQVDWIRGGAKGSGIVDLAIDDPLYGYCSSTYNVTYRRR